MKILFVTPNPPSLIRVRSFNLIRHLAQRGHKITIATPWRGTEEYTDVQRLREEGFEVVAHELTTRQILQNSLRAMMSGLPLQAMYGEIPSLLQELQNKVSAFETHDSQFDIIHVEHLRGARYGMHLFHHLAKRPEKRPPFLWDSVDCISHLFAQAVHRSNDLKGRWIARLEINRTRRFEAHAVPVFDRVLVTSPIDKAAFYELPQIPATVSNDHIAVLPNGVDLNYFRPSHINRQPKTILFSGKMSYHANVTAAIHLITKIMPHVWSVIPSAKLMIVGKNPPAALRNLAKRFPNVTVTGTVPDLRPYLQQATVAAAPLLYSAGIQNKVLEAMACATPVVVSQKAAAALQAIPNVHFLVADDATSFARFLIDVIRDPELQTRLGQAGREFVEHNHNWQHIAASLEKIYINSLASTNPQTPPHPEVSPRN